MSTTFLKPGDSTWNEVIIMYKRGAKERGLPYNIDRQLFIEVASKNCHYCGSSPIKYNKYIKKDGSRIIGSPRTTFERIEKSWINVNGIDRVDNSKGYESDNILPCCFTCNRAKNTLTYEQFIEFLNGLVEYRKNIMS